jgi:tRNA(Met) cytidine acetyltransferase
VGEVLRFAPQLRFTPPLALSERAARYDVIVIDEAAQLPVPLLRRITRAHPHAHIAFATTVRGYEGTGRGFVLRFLDQLRRDERPLSIHRLEAPIRWDAEDPLEARIFDALALDAAPASEDDLAAHISAPRGSDGAADADEPEDEPSFTKR